MPSHLNLENICVQKEHRKIRNDHTLSFGNKLYLFESPLKHSIAKPGKLSAFEDYIQSRLLHASPDWILAAVLYREIQALGYTGGERMVRKLN